MVTKKKLLALLISVTVCLPVFSANFYWVGNSGNWGDKSHWAATSGGNGGYGVPTINDHVIFDSNSFTLPYQKVTVTGKAYCNNLDFGKLSTTASIIGSGTTSIYINGSLLFHKLLSNNFYGKVYLTSNGSGNQITTVNVPFKGDLITEGNGGSWELNNALLLSKKSTLSLKAGEINANGNIISVGYLQNTGVATLDIKNGKLLVQTNTLIDNNLKISKNNKTLVQLKSSNQNNHNSFSVKDYLSLQQATIDSISTDSTTCNDDCDGEARAFISGGVGPFSYVWPSPCNTVGPTNVLSDTCSFLCVGTYILEVIDHGDGNSSSFQVYSIAEPSPMAIFFSPANPTASCFDTCDAQVTANVVGGNGGYSYLWSTGDTTQLITGMCAGTYTISVSDQKGCDTSRTITITEPTPVEPNATSTDVNCNASCDGTASTAPTGGSGTYVQFDWSNGATTQNISGLCPGTYTVTVTDDDGCIGIDTVTVTEPPFALTITKDSTNISCGGACDGTADVTVSGGTTPYDYSWNTGSTIDSIFGLCPGNYCVTVTDANGCQDSVCFNITEPPVLTSNPTGQDISCNGACDGQVTSTPAGGTSPYQYAWSSGCTTQNCTGLCPGTYIVTVTDANGCTHEDSVTITEPNVLNGNVVTNDASCNGLCDGNATSTPSGGTTPYSWSWNTGATTSSIGGLCAGTYTVTVMDANNCADTITINITEPPPLLANMDSTNITCAGDCDGTATANPSGGTSPYSYTWLPGFETTQSITGLCPGTYTVSILDDNGCNLIDSVTLTEPLPLVVNSAGTDLSCNSVCDGQVTANPTGGSTPYQYNWTGGCTTQSCTNLCAGTYTVTVTDANGCTEVDSVTITEPLAITSNISGNDPSCNGLCDGSTSVNPSGGNSPYSYNWTGGCTTQNCNNLCAGQYFVTITDDNGCTTLDSITLVDPPALQLNGLATDVTCNGDCDGTASANPAGGTSPYQYDWNTTATTQSINGLCPGTYTVTVTDANGCTNDTTFTINEPLPLTTTTIEDSASCDAVCDGQGTVTALGGTTPYSYMWSSGHTTATADSLCTGQHFVTVTDANGCTALDTITISSLINLIINPSVVTIGCNDSCDGGLVANPSGGTPPYNYQWSSGHTTQNVDSLCAGTYFVTVTDSIGCFVIDSVTLTALPVVFQVTDSTVQISCNGVCDGEAWANASGGGPPYSYSWNTGATTAGITGLCPGAYTVIVNDTNGCIDTLNMNIVEPPSLTLNMAFTDVQCNGACDGTAGANPGGGTSPYGYDWSNTETTQNINSLCPGTYTVTVTDANGCTIVDSVAITEPLPITLTETTVDVNCNGDCDGSVNVVPAGGTSPYSYSWNTGCTTQTCTGLCAGTYTVTVTDDNNCTTTTTLTINEPNPLLANTSAVNVDCNANCTGEVSAAPSGGTAPYSYSWNSGCTTQTCTGLCQGTYIVTITDFNGCTVIDTAVVAQPSTLILSMSQSNVSCNSQCNGDATVSVSGGTPTYNYAWSNGQTDSTATGLCAGTYTVTVTDQSGCTGVDTVTISEPSPINPNTVTVESTCGNCDGEVSVSPTGGVPPYSYMWNNGPTTPSQTGLCSGIYTVTITDFLNCDTVITIPLSDIGGPTGEIIATVDPTCNGGCDGTATVTPIGGTSPFTYLWDASANNQTTQTATGLCAGTYILQITDSNNCNHFVSVVLTEPSTIQGNIITTDANCNGDCNGSATANPIGGNSPYLYAWSTGGNSAAISNLCAGTYTVTITDNDGCTTVDTAVVNEPALISIVIGFNDAVCNGNCDGDATATPSGGTPGYNYLWSDGQTDSTATGLCAGTYTVTVTDINGCTNTAMVAISEATVIAANPAVTESSCGNCDGSITVNPTGGSGTYNYTWENPLPPNQTVNNLCAGVYDLTITDSNGCTATFSIGVSDSAGATTNTNGTNTTCFGDCDGTATVTILFGTGPFAYLWNDPGNQTTATATGLCAGTYLVEVTDGNGCITIDTIDISEPTQITNNPIVNDATCNGACDGNITANPSGGIVPYSYDWNTAATTQSINNLCAGTYTVTITDADNCSTIDTITVSESNALTANVAGTDAACNGICNGSATANPSGGTAPYDYGWNTGATTQTIATLCAGTYTVTITDDNGCTTEETVIIAEPSAIQANEAITDATCGLCDGVITLAPSGGTGPYLYNWGPGGETTSSINNLCVGVYDVTVTDDVGCSQEFIFIINNIGGPTATATGTDATCFGDCDGTANVVATGGTTPYSFLWNPAGETTTNVNGLCAGTYEIYVTDSNNCVGIDTVLIEDPDPIVGNFSGTDVLCNGDCDGTATANPTGGSGGYLYQWDVNANNQTTQTATGLCAGNYGITVTDVNGCTLEDSVTVNEPTPIAVNDSSDNGNCNGSCDGIAYVNPTNGTAPYSYNWNTGDTTQSITDLCQGTYTVTVTDDNGCTETATIVIGEPSVITTTMAGNDASCNNVCDGDATVTPVGGTPPFSYDWSPSGFTTQAASGLCAGTHYVEVTDSNGCQTVDSVVINQPGAIALDSTQTIDASCGNTDGQITIFVSGGSGNYTYQWDANANNQTDSVATGLGSGLYTVTVTDGSGCTNLFTIPLSDSNGPNVTITVTGASCNGDCTGEANAVVTGGTPPYTYSWNNGDTGPNADTLCPGVITLLVTDSLGCTTALTDTIDSSSITLTPIPVSPTCPGDCDGEITIVATGAASPFTYQWDAAANNQTTATAIGLCAGSYSVTVTDTTGCEGIATINLVDPDTIIITLDTAIAATCINTTEGEIQITVTGGVTPYNYLWNGPNGYTSNIEDINNLLPGEYTVIVTDSAGCSDSLTVTVDTANILIAMCTGDTSICEGSVDSILLTGSYIGTGVIIFGWYDTNFTQISTDTFVNVLPTTIGSHSYHFLVDDGTCLDTCTSIITVTSPPIADAGEDQTIISGNSVQIGGDPTGPFGATYSWNPFESLDDTSAANPTASPEVNTTYIVMVMDSSGCTATDSATVLVVPQISFPNGFSPNADGTNDVWVIDFIDQYPDAEVEVYNRWGEMLFYSRGYATPWDGTYKGSELPVGTYYYIIELNHPDAQEPFTGPVTIMR